MRGRWRWETWYDDDNDNNGDDVGETHRDGMSLLAAWVGVWRCREQQQISRKVQRIGTNDLEIKGFMFFCETQRESMSLVCLAIPTTWSAYLYKLTTTQLLSSSAFSASVLSIVILLKCLIFTYILYFWYITCHTPYFVYFANHTHILVCEFTNHTLLPVIRVWFAKEIKYKGVVCN